MILRSIFLAVAMASTLAACSTNPVTVQSAAAVPSARIYQPAYVGAAIAPSDATVVFLRDSGFSGSGCSYDMYVDNVKVFAIRSGEQITIHVPAGRHFYRLETGGGLCPNVATSQESVIEAGGRQVYRALLPSDFSLRLTRME